MHSKHAEIVTGCICILIAVALILYIRTTSWYTPGAPMMDNTSIFPIGACVILALLGIRQCLWAMRLPLSDTYVTVNIKGIALVALWVAFAFLMPVLGFLAGGILFLALSIFLWGEKRLSYIFFPAICLPLVVYVTLGKILHVSYPKGILPF